MKKSKTKKVVKKKTTIKYDYIQKGSQKFVFVDKKYYKNNESQYYKDLAEERGYVSRHVHIVPNGDYENPKLKVYDKITGKRLNSKKFYDYFKLKKHELRYLCSKQTIKLGINSMFQQFQKMRLFQVLINSKDLDELSIYQNIYLNDELINLSDLIIEITNYESDIENFTSIYKFMLSLKVDGNECAIDINNEFIDLSKGINSGKEPSKDKGFSDKKGNFILFSS